MQPFLILLFHHYTVKENCMSIIISCCHVRRYSIPPSQHWHMPRLQMESLHVDAILVLQSLEFMLTTKWVCGTKTWMWTWSCVTYSTLGWMTAVELKLTCIVVKTSISSCVTWLPLPLLFSTPLGRTFPPFPDYTLVVVSLFVVVDP